MDIPLSPDAIAARVDELAASHRCDRSPRTKTLLALYRRLQDELGKLRKSWETLNAHGREAIERLDRGIVSSFYSATNAAAEIERCRERVEALRDSIALIEAEARQ